MSLSGLFFNNSLIIHDVVIFIDRQESMYKYGNISVDLYNIIVYRLSDENISKLHWTICVPLLVNEFLVYFLLIIIALYNMFYIFVVIQIIHTILFLTTSVSISCFNMHTILLWMFKLKRNHIGQLCRTPFQVLSERFHLI